jgi:hypothetical protein
MKNKHNHRIECENESLKKENISLFFNEVINEELIESDLSKEKRIQKMMEEFENVIPLDNDLTDNFNTLNDTLSKEFYNNDELYYNEEYNIKELLEICEYYDIEKPIKSSKCKKQDIISTIIYFESLPENYEIVDMRNKMWAYMTELYNDKKMKKYVIWSNSRKY